MKIHMFPMFDDNYGYVLESSDGVIAAIDPGDVNTVQDYLQSHDMKLDYILNTHHHWDHIGGNAKLKKLYDCKIIGPKNEASKIPLIDRLVDQGDVIEIGSSKISVISTGGHTLGHISFYVPENGAVFVGDTIFSLGCGKLFEGTPDQMWESFTSAFSLRRYQAV